MFELLFNYPQELWQDAVLVFNSPWPVLGLPLALLLLALMIAVSLFRRKLSVHRRWAIGILQGVAATALLIMLWQPALLVSTTEPGENTVAWILDTSSSMSRVDAVSVNAKAKSRIDAGLSAVSSIVTDKTPEFAARLYSAGQHLASVESIEALRETPLSPRSQLAPALIELLGSVNNSALAAAVLISDGADNSQQINAQWWQQLAAAGVPVHTVGVGSHRASNDIELADVSVPGILQPETHVSARLNIKHTQSGVARVRVTTAGTLLVAQDIQLPADVNSSLHSVVFNSGEAGVRQLDIDIELLTDEKGSQAQADPYPVNNSQARIIQVVDAPKRILYVEGEPRWEYKFLRRAMNDQTGVDVVSLLRTSPNKFYRQGVSDASELKNGFPTTREQLFSYDAVIIGSLEAAELSTAQQTALRDFVSVRGGSLLMLGGRHGLADGGWGRSVVAAALPVVLTSRLSSDTFVSQRVKVQPTVAGSRTPWLQLAESKEMNQLAWDGLPELANVQSVGQVKPGALVLLERPSVLPGAYRAEPLFVIQRYGRGQSAVLGSSGTWRWQMSLPSDDQRHERFWRQTLAALVEDTQQRLSVETTDTVYRDSDSSQLALLAYNPDYSHLQVSSLPVSVTQPDGSVGTVNLYPDNQRPGRYLGTIPLNDDGAYSLQSSTPLDGESPSAPVINVEQWWIRQSGNAEQFAAQLNDDFLRRIAKTTGGRYVEIADFEQLGDILAQGNAALKRENRFPLWNMPVLFLCLFFAKALEWLFRLRWRRL